MSNARTSPTQPERRACFTRFLSSIEACEQLALEVLQSTPQATPQVTPQATIQFWQDVMREGRWIRGTRWLVVVHL